MVPAAIAAIYCHLRWQDGSPRRWPLTHPDFSHGLRLELRSTPLSDITICLGGWAVRIEWMMAEMFMKSRWSYAMFCLPQEAGEFPTLLSDHKTSLWPYFMKHCSTKPHLRVVLLQSKKRWYTMTNNDKHMINKCINWKKDKGFLHAAEYTVYFVWCWCWYDDGVNVPCH